MWRQMLPLRGMPLSWHRGHGDARTPSGQIVLTGIMQAMLMARHFYKGFESDVDLPVMLG